VCSVVWLCVGFSLFRVDLASHTHKNCMDECECVCEPCRLCTGTGKTFAECRKRRYLRCERCGSVFLARRDLPQRDAEQHRYTQHRNTEADAGYMRFLAPLMSAVRQQQSPLRHVGLDFGSGPEPVVARVLQREGFTVQLYDPFFASDASVLVHGRYDFVICCEVMEHFFSPREEWRQLRALLRPPSNSSSKVYAMTELLTRERAEDAAAFARWGYKNDFTHVFFYTPRALEYIRDNFGFASVDVTGRLIVFSL